MTATDELRAMLDERGVEWWPMHDDEAGYRDDRDTEFLVYGCKHVAHEWGCRLQVDMLTPEQAIAATLGSGKLTAEQVRELIAPHLDARPTFDFGHHGAVWRADFQAIADELNAAMGGECENVAPDYLDFLCSVCGFVHYHSDENDTGDGNDWAYCPRCGKAVKR